jgi:hypothetical protein
MPLMEVRRLAKVLPCQSFTKDRLREKTEPPQPNTNLRRNGIHPTKYNARAGPAVDALISVR